MTLPLDEFTPEPVKLRGWADVPTIRNSIYDLAKSAVVNRFNNLENDTHKLVIQDVDYSDPEPSLRDEKKALLDKRTLARKLSGRYQLVDKATGQVISETNKKVLAHVPHMTRSGTFIRNGNEYVINNQQRLRAGVFARKKKSGDFESQFNVLPGTGKGFRLRADPATGLFKFVVGQGDLPALPILTAAGVKTADLMNLWGKELFEKNSKLPFNKQQDAVFKFASLLGKKSDQVTKENAFEKIPEILSRTGLDDIVTSRTLGSPYKNITPEVLLAANRRLLGIMRGTEEPDERDSIDFQTFLGPEDFIKESLERDADGAARKVLWKAAYNKSLDWVPSGSLTPNIDNFFDSSQIASMLSQINPFETYDQLYKVTRLGMGGISNERSVDLEGKGVQPTHYGFIDALRAPESGRAGLDLRLAYRTFKGSDNQIYSEVRDVKNNTVKNIPASLAAKSTLAFAGELKSNKKYVAAIKNGRMQMVDRDTVDYEIPHGEDSFSPLTNMVPLMAHAKGQRMLMGARMLSQTVSLDEPEARFVQAKDSRTNRSFDELFSENFGAKYSKKPGTVVAVTADTIKIKNEDGTVTEEELYDHHPFNMKGFMHNTPVVKVGDKVGEGQILARSNYTDASGRAAYGRNLKVAFHTHDQDIHDDGIVISESASRKLASNQITKERLESSDTLDEVNYKRFRSLFPGVYSKEQLDKVDPETGMIKVGSTINYGDPLILGIGKVKASAASSIMRQKKDLFSNASKKWEHSDQGLVVDSRPTKGGYQVVIKYKSPVKVGDKVSNFYGGKGVVSRVVPDTEMLIGADGQPIDIVLNPAGLTSRVNPAQVVEANLGKVVAKTGIPYTISQFDLNDNLDFSRKELEKHGLQETEDLVDPKTGKTIPGVYTGVAYIGKLHHMGEGKLSARGVGVYGSDFAPARGGEEDFQSKKQGWLDVLALVSHGATDYLRDKVIRGQRNDDYWRAFRLGHNPPMPRVYEPYERFLAHVQGAGAQIKKEGTRTHLFPLTDSAVQGKELKSADTYDFNTMEPVEGGLFDPAMTGGAGGNQWNYIKLGTHIPNPTIEAPLKTLLGLTGPEFEKVLGGSKELNGLTGPNALKTALQRIDVNKELEKSKEIVKEKSGTVRDHAIKKIRLLEMLRKYSVKPEELMISKIPVIPAKYRPVSSLNGTPLVADANYLYKEVFEANENYKLAKDVLGDSSEDVVNLYKATKGLFGIGEPISEKNVERNVRGLLRDFVGKGSPKGGALQSKVIGGTMDTVGRSVVTPDPALKMDEVSIPNDIAYTVFEDFILRKMIQNGFEALAAKDHIEKRTEVAGKYLDEVMSERPVVLNRAPTLHKHNQLGLWASRHEGSDIKVPLAPLSGLNMDFDGDSCRLYTVIGKGVDSTIPCGTTTAQGGNVMPFSTDTKVLNSQLETVFIGDFPRIEESKKATSYGFEYDVPEGTIIYAMDPETNEHRWFPVTKWSEHLNLDCYLVSTSSGKTIVASEDHSLIVWNGEKLVKETPSNSVGKLAPITNFRNSPILSEVKFTRKDGIKEAEETFKLDRDTGNFLGMIIGDGCVTVNDAIFLYGVNDKGKVLNKFKEIAETKTPYGDASSCLIEFETESIDGVVRKKARMQIQNKRWLTKLLGDAIGRDSFNKKIPGFCLQGSDEHLVGILDGLISTDGSVSVSNGKAKPQLMVNFATSSVDLVVGIKLLLHRLKVRSSHTKYISKYSGKDAFTVTISTVDLKKLYASGILTGFTHPTKDEIFKKYINSVSSSPALTKDKVPYPNSLDGILKSTYNTLNNKKTASGKTYFGSLPSAKSQGFISREIVKDLLDNALKITTDLLEDSTFTSYVSLVNDSNVTWDVVESAEKLSEKMTAYDLTVPGPYTFATADGLIVQDTANIHVPVSPGAVKDVIEKMMPSKNLITPSTQQIHMKPEQMALLGLYRATAPANTTIPPKVFNSKADVIKAYSRGELKHDDPVIIRDN